MIHEGKLNRPFFVRSHSPRPCTPTSPALFRRSLENRLSIVPLCLSIDFSPTLALRVTPHFAFSFLYPSICLSYLPPVRFLLHFLLVLLTSHFIAAPLPHGISNLDIAARKSIKIFSLVSWGWNSYINRTSVKEANLKSVVARDHDIFFYLFCGSFVACDSQPQSN